MSDKSINKLPIIKTREQLKMVLDGLQEQGFGYYVGVWKAHEDKVNKLINANNKLNLEENKYKSELNTLVSNMTNYDEIDNTIKKYFAKFKPDDKINEVFNRFYLIAETNVKIPPINYPERNEIINWVKFKKKYGIKGEPRFNYYVNVYNLDKNIIKLNSIGGYDGLNSFSILYELLFGEKPNEWSNKKSGIWQDLGKIQIKLYLNGNMDVKGEIEKMKLYLYKQLETNCIVIYNKKMEIREYKREIV